MNTTAIPDRFCQCCEAVISVAVDHGFECREVIEMPANNLSVIFVCV